MLLPSDVARLVLGYLQQEGLSATSRAFICESPNQPRPISASQSPGHLPVASSVTSQCVPSPLPTPQGMLGHSTPVSYTSQYSRPSTLCLTQIGESPLQILVPDHRLNPGPLSPARRKCDSPRRRGGGQMGASGTCRSAVVSSAVTVETFKRGVHPLL